MRIWGIVLLVLMFTTAAHAQYRESAVDFFMHDRIYDMYLRDYYRFKEPKPLRIEYWYMNWLDSSEDASEYADHLQFEGTIPIYRSDDFLIDIPFQYTRMPIWAENEEDVFGNSINTVQAHLITRWVITERFKSLIGWKYCMRGDGEMYDSPSGRMITILDGLFSYDLHTQLNFATGARIDRYYYDTREEPDLGFELSDRLYLQPEIMLKKSIRLRYNLNRYGDV